MDCFFKGCKQNPILYCTCLEKSYICAAHIAQHQFHPPNTSYKMFPILKTVKESEKQGLITILSNTIKNNELLRNELLKFTQEIISFTEKSISSISSLNKINKRILREILTNSIVSFPVSADERFMSSELTPKMIKLFFKESSKNLKLQNLSDKILEYNKKFELKFHNSLHKKNEKLSFFIYQTKNFVEFDTKTSDFTLKIIDSLEPQGRRFIMATVNPEKIFFCGGILERPSSSTFFLNPKTYVVEKLQSGIPRRGSIPVVYNNKIYVFGGYIDACTNSCDYFDLNLNQWFKLSNLPSPKSDVSTIRIDQKILISAQDQFMQIYNISQNTFMDMNSAINPTAKNILIKYKGYVYLLAVKIYRVKCDCLSYFEHINKSVIFEKVLSRAVVRNNHAFFVDEKFNIYKFYFEDYRLKIIRKGQFSPSS